MFIKIQSEHLDLSCTAHMCTASFATSICMHPIGFRDALWMACFSEWMRVRSTAATAGPDWGWMEAVCHPKIARGWGHQLGRSVVDDPAMTGASATTGDGWCGRWISNLFSGNNFRTLVNSNSRGWGEKYISTLQRSHADGGFG